MFEYLIAFGAGLISFLSPCVLPLIPGYVSYISGQSLQEIIESKKEILSIYLEYVERKLSEGHDLGRMMKHLFGLSRGDQYAKSFRIKILEIIKSNCLTLNNKKDLEKLLIY